jgi:hypothetical protein
MKPDKNNSPMTFDELRARPTVPVPTYGKVVYGLSRNGSYEAAKKGIFPTFRLGSKKLLVPVRAALRQAGLE